MAVTWTSAVNVHNSVISEIFLNQSVTESTGKNLKNFSVHNKRGHMKLNYDMSSQNPIERHPHLASPSQTKKLWTEIPCDTNFQFTATFDIPP